MSENLILKIEKITSQGYGLGFIDNKAIFIPFCYPQEIHKIQIIEDKNSYAFAKSIEEIKISNEKRKPPCELFGICGGCQFQNINYDYQIKLKKNILEESLKRIGKINIQINDIIPSDLEFRYRNKGSFQIKNKQFGYCYPKTTKVLFFNSCLLLDKLIEKRINELKNTDLLNGLKTINIRSNTKGEVIDSINKKAFFIEEINNLKFIIDINSFFQINNNIIPKWLNYIKSLVSKNTKLAIDLYCGVGVIGQSIADISEKVIGIEINKRQIKQAKESAKLNNIKNIDFIFADASKFLNYTEKLIDLIIINPPRSGMSKETIENIIKIKPKQIIYSSCNPDTFSRDCVNLISNGYELLSIMPFDMFPQTYHLEVVGNFIR